MELVALKTKSRNRLAPAELWDSLAGPKPRNDWDKTDGCSFSPDFLYELPVWLACRLHDFHYSQENPLNGDRRQADRILKENLNLIFDYGNVGFLRRFIVVNCYWLAVRLKGAKAFKGRK